MKDLVFVDPGGQPLGEVAAGLLRAAGPGREQEIEVSTGPVGFRAPRDVADAWLSELRGAETVQQVETTPRRRGRKPAAK